MLWLRAILTPIRKVGSFISRTIADVDVALFTTPTNPNSPITVISFLIPSFDPASIVIVWLKVEALPFPITRAETTL